MPFFNQTDRQGQGLYDSHEFRILVLKEGLFLPQILRWSKLKISGVYAGFFFLVLGIHSFSGWIFKDNLFAWNETWPINIFWFDFPGPAGDWVFLLVQIFSFSLFYWFLKKQKFGIHWVMIISLLLIFGSNLAHSWEKGFRLPHIGPSQYFANADLGNQPLQFLSDFNHIQENLSVHSRSHPPGAVLFYALLGQMQFGETGLISLWILIFSALVSAWFLFEFLKREFPGENAGRFSFLFLLIPGVMIYFCASLDAVICAITISFFYFLRQEDNLLND